MPERRHRVRGTLTPEEKRRLLARRRYDKRYRKIDQLQRRKGPQFLMVLLSILALALILYKVFGPELLREEDVVVNDTFVGTEPDRSANVRLDATPYRAGIEALEGPLFGDRGAGSLNELGVQVSLGAQALIDRLAATENPRLGRLAATLEQLAEEATRTEFDLARLTELRSTWADARDEAFLPTEWFGASADSISEDAGMQTVYLQAASSLFDLAETARAEAESLSEAIGDGESVDGAWREFELSFEDQLRDIEWSLPEERPGSRTEPRVLAAIQKLELAFEQVRDLVLSAQPSFPPRPEPFEQAIEVAQDAVDAFEAFDET